MNYIDIGNTKIYEPIVLNWRKKKKKFMILKQYSICIYKYIFDMTTSFHNNYTKGYVSQDKYTLNMECLEKIKDDYLNVYNLLSNKKIINIYNYYHDIHCKLDTILVKILKIQKIIGTLSIYTILETEFNLSSTTIPSNIDTQLLNFYNTNYNCLSYDIYDIDDEYNIIEHKDEIKCNIFTNQNNIGDTNKTFDKNIITNLNKNNNKLFCKNRENDMNSNLNYKLSNGKIFLTLDDKQKIIVFDGIFVDDPLNMSVTHDSFALKHSEIINNLKLTPINSSSFKKSFLTQLSLRDLVCLNVSDIINNCIQQYSEIKRLKGKTISNLVKEFLSSDHHKQRDMLSLFLMCEEDKETQYLAYLMYDMISCDSYLIKPQVCNEDVYVSLHWSLKKIFKCAVKNIIIYQNKIDTNVDIPYEKKIMLLKCDDSVKQKANEKMKEIQSKNGENCIKAQQYLDGLLRIPFKIFIREPILSFLQDFKLKVMSEINYLISLKDNSQIIKHIQLECDLLKDKNLTSFEITKYFDTMKHIIVNSKENNKVDITILNKDYLDNFNTKTAWLT